MATKNLWMLVAFATVMVVPNQTFAWVWWDGDAGNGVWADPLNWDGDKLPTNEYFTEEARIEPGFSPVIAEGNDTEWDRGRIRNGAIVTQTGGTHRWKNYTSSNGLAIFVHDPGITDPSVLHMTGGTHYGERVTVGLDLYASSPTDPPEGLGVIDIWGDGTFVVEPNTFDDPANSIYRIHYLWIAEGSKIDIRDNGKLRVPSDLSAMMDEYISLGRIIAGEEGTSLLTATIGDEYVISIAGAGGLLGDLNGDGLVGSADLDIVRANWGQSVDAGCLPCGDPSGDGAVGSADLDIVRANWGQHAATAAAVPEPGVLTLILGAVVVVFGVTRRNGPARTT